MITDGKTLITGATGSLGKQLVHDFVQRGVQPIAQVRESSDTAYLDRVGLEKRKCDLNTAPSFQELLRGIDAVIHTAAWVNFRQDRPTQFAALNTVAAVKLFQAAAEAGVKRFVQVSTIAAVGARARRNNKTSKALSESDLINEEHDFNLAHLRIPYILSKHSAEDQLQKLASNSSTELVMVNPSVIIAPSRTGDDRGKARKSFKWLLAPDLPNRINLVDIRDVVPGVIGALEKGRPGERYILAGDNITVRALLLDISSILGVAPHLVRLPRTLLNVASRGAVTWSKLTGKGKVSFYPDLVRLLEYDWAYSSMKARRELGFTNRSIERSLEDLLTNNMTGTYLKP
ncbi:MAG: SDR family oxidoreductase [candidate division Zixibacteria bacterium]|nr:SDR family oxidoreductase [candidate division Zixibacteria bacterium]